ncbi:toll/interleukin-1 receptor domain-containing protein [Streptomyces sp. NPDC094032]|uniref:toll/interleukin-1 receptor domain-containing protein n=1 Tax=Streptomyces sp. NPDC094032 TaxID=3155308 RepID=UPI0033244995
MSEIFINYRTGDGNEIAALLKQGLSHRFGQDAVFFAGLSIRPSQTFSRELLTHVRRSGVVLSVMGPDWASHPDLHKETDWVRRELLEAWQCGIPVIPVIRGRRTDRLSAVDLPPELAHLAELQSLRIDSPTHDRDLRDIGDAVAELVPRLAALDTRPSAPATGAPDTTHNSITGDNSGISLQAGNVGEIGTISTGTNVTGTNVTGTTGTVITGPTGPVHTGSGAQHNHTHRPHLSGDGAAYVAGDNHGGISHRFGRAERDEADGR